MVGTRNEDEPLNAMLPNPYGLNEYPGRGSIQYRRTKRSVKLPNRKSGQFSKYGPALRTLIPIRAKKQKDGVIPVENIGCISTVLFSWMTPLMWKGYKKGLEPQDVYKCPMSDGCFANGARLSKLWAEELGRKGPDKASLIRVLFRFLRTRVILQCILFTFVIVLGILAPAYFMLKIINFIESGSSETHIGIAWAVGLTLVELTRTTLMTWLWSIALRTATRLRSACMHLLYRKIFKMADNGERSIGELVNMFSNDASTLYEAPLYIPLIIGGPLMIIAGLIYVYWLLGAMSLTGMLVFLVFFPIQVGISKIIGTFRKRTLKIKDRRANKMTELVTCIKLLKLYAWESAFGDNIAAIRNQERKSLEKGQYMQSFSLSLAPAVPVMAAVVTFLVHIAVKGDLTVAQAFTTLTLYYIIGMAIRTLPHEIRSVILTKISIDRIKNVLTSPELDPYVTKLDREASDHVRLVSATLSWDCRSSGSTLVIWQTEELSEHLRNKQRSDDPMIGDEFDHSDPGDLASSYAIKNINMSVEKGSLVAVIGRTGSGKSSLLAALIGKMTLVGGTVSLGGSCAYVGQQPWIMNGTLRENVLLDEAFDAKWYYHVIHSCELTDDISQLPGGDNTQVGDRGVRLSGGQKLRVCLARAIYSKKEIYLLDDCFSAVDSRVAMKIFNTVIRKTLARKTVIIVTHNVQFLEYFDEVMVMEEGEIIETGSHHSLLQSSVYYTNLISSFENLQKCEEEKLEPPKKAQNGELNMNFKQWDNNIGKLDGNKEDVDRDKMRRPSAYSTADTDSSEEDDDDNSIIDRQLDDTERLEKGYISWYTYKRYIKSSGGYLVCLLVLLSLAVNVGCGTFSSWWLSRWLNAGSGDNGTECIDFNSTDPCKRGSIGNNPNLNYYQAIYGLSVGFVLMTNILRAFIFTKAALKASTSMHDTLFKKVIMSPMKFFDYTPIGRILNLFTKDQDVVDTRLPLRLEILFQYFFILFFAIIVVAIIIPWMFLAITIFGIVFYYVHKIFHNAIRDIKRLQNVSWPGVFSHLATTMQGVDSIRVYHKQESFVERFDRLYDQCSAPLYLYNSANRWLGIRLEAIAICITMVTAILTVVLRDRISPAYAGLALSYTVQFCTYFQYMVRTLNQAEADFTSFERQLSYSEILQTEDAQINQRNEKIVEKECPDGWPKRGRISFQNVSMRYQPTLLPVLRGVSFDVFPGEKVGIVGRTGAGKSSLGVVLFRLVEISTGVIYIDGVDISKLPLYQLRSRLSVIPQDPVMFEGTIRDNLDPRGEYTDNELWKALEKAFMKSKIVSLGGHLQAPVRENGKNFSVGQRQLLCLARAILRKSKIILLDEATASIDMETDSLIQRTLQDFFGNSTVLTIAHRLHTVNECDRILVMHNGRVAEFDTPVKLLANTKSLFSSMMAANSPDGSI